MMMMVFREMAVCCVKVFPHDANIAEEETFQVWNFFRPSILTYTRKQAILALCLHHAWTSQIEQGWFSVSLYCIVLNWMGDIHTTDAAVAWWWCNGNWISGYPIFYCLPHRNDAEHKWNDWMAMSVVLPSIESDLKRYFFRTVFEDVTCLFSHMDILEIQLQCSIKYTLSIACKYIYSRVCCQWQLAIHRPIVSMLPFGSSSTLPWFRWAC